MKRINRVIGLGVWTWALGVLLVSCEQKELCYDHPHALPARINVDWTNFTEETPTGMTVMVYNAAGEAVRTMHSNELSYVNVSLTPALYSAVAYNQSPSEFGTLQFQSMEELSEATVRTVAHTSRWYVAKQASERVVQAPEWFAADAAHQIRVPEFNWEQYSRQASRSVIATLMPRNVVYTIKVIVHVQNIYNVRSARASLTGLADGYRFGTLSPTTTTATQLLEDWSIAHDADNPMNGTLTATIHSFGLPANHSGLPAANHFQLSLLLVDNRTKLDYDFAVGNRFEQKDNVELSLLLEESIAQPLPDVKPEGGHDGGFDVKVDDWGDEVNIDIPM